eukprot:13627160-Alexandrium_andersonii.AAC.1
MTTAKGANVGGWSGGRGLRRRSRRYAGNDTFDHTLVDGQASAPTSRIALRTQEKMNRLVSPTVWPSTSFLSSLST